MFIFLIVSLGVLFWNRKTDNKTLEEVKLKEENIINNKNFAIMVEKSDGSGYIAEYKLSTSNSVRPVFYLTSEVQFESGTGTSDDPFIIS